MMMMIPNTINKNAIVDAKPIKKNVSMSGNIGAKEYAIIINITTITTTTTINNNNKTQLLLFNFNK